MVNAPSLNPHRGHLINVANTVSTSRHHEIKLDLGIITMRLSNCVQLNSAAFGLVISSWPFNLCGKLNKWLRINQILRRNFNAGGKCSMTLLTKHQSEHSSYSIMMAALTAIMVENKSDITKELLS